jgi:replicative DNA helicase
LDLQNEILESATNNHFSEGRKKLLTIIRTITAKGITANAITVNDHAEQTGELEAIGGPSMVAEIATYASGYGQWKNHFALLEEMRYRREGMECTDWMKSQFQDMTLPLESIKETVESRVLKMDFASEERETASTKQAVKDAVDVIERLYTGQEAMGLQTGFKGIDRLFGGLMPSEMSIWAARPSVGKTAIVMQIAHNAAVVDGKRVVVFSAEMSAGQLMQRQIFSLARVTKDDVKYQRLKSGDFQKISLAASSIGSADLIVNDKSSPSIGYIKAMARRYHKIRPVDLIVIDYLQLLTSSTKRAKDSRLLEVAEISAGLKEIAKTLNCHVAAAAQLNRDVENRKGGRPRSSDLRECGNIEQDADAVVLMSRADEKDDDQPREDNSGEIRIEIAKQRNGPTGEVKLHFNAPYTRFEEVAWQKD